MPDYIITGSAGRRIAGHPNTGVGTTISLPEGLAAGFVATGELRLANAGQEIDASPENPAAGSKVTVAAVEVAEIKDAASTVRKTRSKRKG